MRASSLERITNIGVLLIAILTGVVVIRSQFFPKPSAPSRDLVGQRFDVVPADLRRTDRTAVLVLSTRCSFCDESAPFYRKLAAEQKAGAGFGAVAVFAESATDAKSYLAAKAIDLDRVVADPSVRSVIRGTPTLMILDRKGTVIDMWVGLLDENREQEIISRLKS